MHMILLYWKLNKSTLFSNILIAYKKVKSNIHTHSRHHLHIYDRTGVIKPSTHLIQMLNHLY